MTNEKIISDPVERSKQIKEKSKAALSQLLVRDPLPMSRYQGLKGVDASQHGYAYPEAYAIMRYQSKTVLKSVFVWNSRDGFAPFCIHVDGMDYVYTDPLLNRFAPFYRPGIGEYIFRNCNLTEAKEIAKNRLYKYQCMLDTENVGESEETIISRLAPTLLTMPVLCRVSNIVCVSDPV